LIKLGWFCFLQNAWLFLFVSLKHFEILSFHGNFIQDPFKMIKGVYYLLITMTTF